jgi:hypothetical protein
MSGLGPFRLRDTKPLSPSASGFGSAPSFRRASKLEAHAGNETRRSTFPDRALRRGCRQGATARMAWWEAELRGRRHALSRNAFLQATSSELGALLVFLVALQQIAACWTLNGASEHHEGRSA